MAIYPVELQDLDQWVCWRIEQRKGKVTKIPVNPHTGAKASVDTPSTWGAYADALAGMQRFGCAGVGFVFTSDDPNCGVDLDKCIDPRTGEISELAERIIERLQSYTALSQSQQGIHLIIRGKLPPGRRQGSFGGLYEAGRFFALTGNLFPGSPTTIEDRQAELEALHIQLFPPPATPRPTPLPTSQPVSLSDAELLDRMFDARNGEAVRRLWDGDVSGHVSHSEADLALCSHLAFWCGGDASRVDALFRQSGIYREGKWERQDYRERTIGKALEQGRFYDVDRPRRPRSFRGSARLYNPTWPSTAVQEGGSWH
jgi:primase-polymerase (primpol)-like protein